MTPPPGRALAIGLLGVLAACDAPSGDDDLRLAPADAFGVVAPAAADEVALTSAVADDLFPALHGDDLVWVRIDVDATKVAPDDEPPDCLKCISCEACRWRVMHRRLTETTEQVLWTGRWVVGAPAVHDGLATFVDGDSVLRLVDLTLGVTERIQGAGYVGRAPRVQDALVWWFAWDQDAGGTAILAWDVTVPGFVTKIRADIAERWWLAGSLGGVARPQPFALDGERVVWTTGSTEGRVESARLTDGERTTMVVDPARIHLSPLAVGDAIVTLSYAVAEGCGETRCELELSRVDDGIVTPLSADAMPTIYVSPVGDGRRVVWVDKREGAYILVGMDVAAGGVERRLSSEDARVGALSPPTIDDGRVVWSDRRSGRWQLRMRAW